MKTLRLVPLLLFAAALAAVPACTGSGKTKVAFVSNNPEEFWNIAEAGFKKGASEESDIEAIFKKPAEGDPAVQKEVIDNLINQNVKAIAISVINPKDQSKYLDEIADKSLLLTVDNDAPSTKRKCYIGTDNYEAGRAAGVLVKKALPDGGVIAIFVGQLESLNAQQRRQGVLDELAGVKNAKGEGDKRDMYGKYRLYKDWLDQPQGPAKAKENAIAAIADLEKEEKVCFIGLWAYNPPQMLSAVKDKEKLGKIKLVGFDEATATLDGIRDGYIEGTIVQQPFEFGYQSFKVMAALTRGDKSKIPENGIIHIPHKVITKGGGSIKTSDLKDGDKTYAGQTTEGMEVEAFHKKLNEMLGKK